MSAIIMMRVTVKRGRVKEFLDAIAWEHMTITDIWKAPTTYEFFFQPTSMGYMEPWELYVKWQHFVKDVHHCVVSDPDLVNGKDVEGYQWFSAKKEHEEE